MDWSKVEFGGGEKWKKTGQRGRDVGAKGGGSISALLARCAVQDEHGLGVYPSFHSSTPARSDRDREGEGGRQETRTHKDWETDRKAEGVRGSRRYKCSKVS